MDNIWTCESVDITAKLRQRCILVKSALPPKMSYIQSIRRIPKNMLKTVSKTHLYWSCNEWSPTPNRQCLQDILAERRLRFLWRILQESIKWSLLVGKCKGGRPQITWCSTMKKSFSLINFGPFENFRKEDLEIIDLPICHHAQEGLSKKFPWDE